MLLNRALRKLMSRSLFISVPKSFLKPKSVYGLMYFSFVIYIMIYLSFAGKTAMYKVYCVLSIFFILLFIFNLQKYKNNRYQP